MTLEDGPLIARAHTDIISRLGPISRDDYAGFFSNFPETLARQGKPVCSRYLPAHTQPVEAHLYKDTNGLAAVHTHHETETKTNIETETQAQQSSSRKRSRCITE